MSLNIECGVRINTRYLGLGNFYFFTQVTLLMGKRELERELWHEQNNGLS